MSQLTSRFDFIARMAIFAVAALLPVWFIPGSLGIEFGREATFTILVAIAVIAYLFRVLVSGEMRVQKSLIWYVALLLLVVAALSTFFSKAPLVSLFFGDASAEKLSTLILGLALMGVVGSVFRTYKEAGAALLIFLFSAGFGALLTFVQLLFGVSAFSVITSSAGGIDFNVIGTLNGLALFYGVCMIMGLGIVLSPVFREWRRWVQYGMYASVGFFFLDLLLINFRTAWIALFGVGLLLSGFVFASVRARYDGGESSFIKDWRSWPVMGLLVLSAVFIMVRMPIFGGLEVLPEVSPAFSTTWGMARSVWAEGATRALFGSGPATFGLEWAHLRSPALNNTIFWDTRFNQGFSWVSTLLVTGGLAGAAALALFLGIVCIVCMRALLKRGGGDAPFGMSAFLGLAVLMIAAVLYPANFTFMMVFFLLVGMLVALLTRRKELHAPVEGLSEEGETMGASVSSPVISDAAREKAGEPRLFKAGWWDIEERVIVFKKSWAVFLSSLVIIFVIALSVVALYYAMIRVRVAWVQMRAVKAIQAGDFEGGVKGFERAAAWMESDYHVMHLLAQVRIEKVKNVIAAAAQGKNMQAEFQAAVTAAMQTIEAAIRLNSEEPTLWRTQGLLYETLIPFIEGSERFADASFRKAAELDPTHPVYLIENARTRVVYADRIRSLLQQGAKENKAALEAALAEALRGALELLDKAIGLKSDLAMGHFLRAQVALREGNVEEAIVSATNARVTAPNDIGVAFQLGLLHYQTGNFDEAQKHFEGAVGLNPNYSNARYFLGLIHDRKGERDGAIEEFEKILALNPDNQEVMKILANLREGAPALDGIVPPAAPPEKRTEAPVEK